MESYQLVLSVDLSGKSYEILTISLIIVALRVDGDKNLLNLVEAELGSRLLRAYLVDNARDANVLSRSPVFQSIASSLLFASRILDHQYGATANKPMIITSR